jgi:hypothetical protein
LASPTDALPCGDQPTGAEEKAERVHNNNYYNDSTKTTGNMATISSALFLGRGEPCYLHLDDIFPRNLLSVIQIEEAMRNI